MERKDVIERAYQLINEPIDPNHKCPVDLEDIVNSKEAEAGEVVEYFASPAQDRGVDTIYTYANGVLTPVAVPLKGVSALTFAALKSKLGYILIDEILNSKDQGALAQRKNSIIRAMDCEEVRRILVLCEVASQEVNKVTGEDILDVIIKLKQKVSDYATDYILMVAADVMDAIETYDKDMAKAGGNVYRIGIKETIADLGIKKIVKVLGASGIDDAAGTVLAAGKAILVGRNSSLVAGRPLTMVRRKFNKEVAELSGAGEGAVRLIDIIKTPMVDAGNNILGYGTYGYESFISVNLNFRAISWTHDILTL